MFNLMTWRIFHEKEDGLTNCSCPCSGREHGSLGLSFQNASAATSFQRVNFVTGVVTADSLNVRQGPSTKFPVVCVLKKGQTVNVFGKLGIGTQFMNLLPDVWSGIFKVYQAAGTTTTQTTKKPAKTSAPKAPAPTPAKASPAPTAAVKTSPAAQVTSTPVTGLNADEQLTLELLTRKERKRALSHSKLMQSCRKWQGSKRRIWLKRTISPPVPTYGSPFDMMRQFNISFRTAGKILQEIVR